MQLEQVIEGPNLQLRTATGSDAEFILELRLDPELSKYIGKTDPSVEKQRNWLENRIALEGDYHMIIETQAGQSLGVVALYNIDNQAGTFEWGRWIVKPGSPRNTAVETALLCYYLGFEVLKLKKAVFGIQKENLRALYFHKKLESPITREETDTIWFEFTASDFKRAATKFKPFTKS